ncbi:MAG: hypothetical protein ABIT38_20435, partial [Gemmatimonadaceae bacterium]
MRFTLAAIVPIALVAASALAQAPRNAAPGKEWPRSTPAALGMNGAVLDSLDAEIKSGQYGYVDRMLVIR